MAGAVTSSASSKHYVVLAEATISLVAGMFHLMLYNLRGSHMKALLPLAALYIDNVVLAADDNHSSRLRTCTASIQH